MFDYGWSIVFVGIIIGVIIYCYRKRKANKSADTLTQPDAASSPSNPFVEQNNISQNVNWWYKSWILYNLINI